MAVVSKIAGLKTGSGHKKTPIAQSSERGAFILTF